MKRTDTLYVSDLDGTLLGPDSRISANSVRLINQAEREGAIFTIATARTPATVAMILSNINLKVPAIVMTGCALWSQCHNRYLHPCFIPEDTVRQMVRIYKHSALPAFIYTLENNKIHVYHFGEMTSLCQEFIDMRIGNPYKVLHRNGEMPADFHSVLMFYSMDEPSKVHPVYNALRQEGRTTPVYYFDMFGPRIAIMEVFAPGVSKAAAMKRLAHEYGLTRTVAFGDNVNDIPMLRAAGLSLAVANALPEVKDAVDEVIGMNTDDAVAKKILQDFNNT